MAYILLFLEQRLRQDKVASIMPANIRFGRKGGEKLDLLLGVMLGRLRGLPF